MTENRRTYQDRDKDLDGQRFLLAQDAAEAARISRERQERMDAAQQADKWLQRLVGGGCASD